MTAAQPFVSGHSLWRWRVQAQGDAIAADVPPDEVDWLLQELTGLDSLALRLESFKDWSLIAIHLPLQDLDRLWQRRVNERLPVQYIAKSTPWRQFNLAVSPAVLIPRPETEELIDLAVAFQPRDARQNGDRCLQQGHWADLGTGSGAIALGLAAALPTAVIHAVDCSSDALAIAKLNAQQTFAERIHFYQGCWWEPLAALQGQMNGMVANPPYIPSSLVPQLQPEVAWHEPRLALDGGADGLDAIRHLVETAPIYLRSGGLWLIEMMAGQAEQVANLLKHQGSYRDIEIHQDLAGIERFALAYRSEE